MTLDEAGAAHMSYGVPRDQPWSWMIMKLK